MLTTPPPSLATWLGGDHQSHDRRWCKRIHNVPSCVSTRTGNAKHKLYKCKHHIIKKLITSAVNSRSIMTLGALIKPNQALCSSGLIEQNNDHSSRQYVVT